MSLTITSKIENQVTTIESDHCDINKVMQAVKTALVADGY